MVTDLSQTDSVVNEFVAELRDASVQQDPLRFRFNLQRLGSAMARVSKSIGLLLPRTHLWGAPVTAWLSSRCYCHPHPARAEQAFVSACRNYTDETHNDFEIGIDAVARRPREGLGGLDPMLATGLPWPKCSRHCIPHKRRCTCCDCEPAGVDHIRQPSQAHLWVAAVDKLNDKGYIILCLGDAGDLAFGASQHARLLEIVLWMFGAVVKFIVTPSLMIARGWGFGRPSSSLRQAQAGVWVFSTLANGSSESGLNFEGRRNPSGLSSPPNEDAWFGFADCLVCGDCSL